MFDTTSFALFFVASWALILTPGPDMVYVLTRGMAHGRRAGLISALGVTVGILVHTLLAAFGLAVILQTSLVAFLLVKYVGAAYLIYLGVKALKDTGNLVLQTDHPALRVRVLFWQGVLSNVTNPKVALFFLAFLPQFVRREAGLVPLQMLMYGLLFAGFGVVFLSLVGWSAGGIGRWLAQQPRHVRPIRWLTGGALIGLGLRLALVERR
ncbi:MAG: LysE family translocator [Chloroflexota bacterium]|nr:LysE family translocator [Chloroflexota bacterium]